MILTQRYQIRNRALQDAPRAYRQHRQGSGTPGAAGWLGLVGLMRALATGRLSGTDYVDRSANGPRPDLRRRSFGALTHLVVAEAIVGSGTSGRGKQSSARTRSGGWFRRVEEAWFSWPVPAHRSLRRLSSPPAEDHLNTTSGLQPDLRFAEEIELAQSLRSVSDRRRSERPRPPIRAETRHRHRSTRGACCRRDSRRMRLELADIVQ